MAPLAYLPTCLPAYLPYFLPPYLVQVGEHLGLDFHSDGSTDGAFLGDCDAGAGTLAAALGWDIGERGEADGDGADAAPRMATADETSHHISHHFDALSLR